MISTYDLVLLGSLISLGGVGFLFRGYRSSSIAWRRGGDSNGKSSEDRQDNRGRAESVAGVRWLTVGALTLFIGYTRGAESGYLFGPWTDILFHVGLLSVCWAATVSRLQKPRARMRKSLPRSTPATVAANHLETTG